MLICHILLFHKGKGGGVCNVECGSLPFLPYFFNDGPGMPILLFLCISSRMHNNLSLRSTIWLIYKEFGKFLYLLHDIFFREVDFISLSCYIYSFAYPVSLQCTLNMTWTIHEWTLRAFLFRRNYVLLSGPVWFTKVPRLILVLGLKLLVPTCLVWGTKGTRDH